MSPCDHGLLSGRTLEHGDLRFFARTGQVQSFVRARPAAQICRVPFSAAMDGHAGVRSTKRVRRESPGRTTSRDQLRERSGSFCGGFGPSHVGARSLL